MATQANSTFSVEGWDEQTFTEGEDALKLTHASVAKTFSGDLEGKGTLWYLMFYGPGEQTRVVGLERVTGTLGGKSGSFVLEHDGADDGREARTQLTILPDSGTGELAGLRGSGEMLATRTGELTMRLEYSIGAG
jgi:hypothetical protein